MKKIISAIMSFSIAGACMFAAYDPLQNNNRIEAEEYTYKVSELVSLISFLTRGGELSDEETSRLDMNRDARINIADVVILKAVLLGDIKLSGAELTVSQLNNYAQQIYNEAQYAANTLEIKGKTLTGEYDLDDNSEFLMLIKGNLEIKKGTKFRIITDENNVLGVICCVGDDTRSGAYPNIISQKMNIPYKTEYVQYAADPGFSWKENFEEYISKDPLQAGLDDYPLESVSELNARAKKIFTCAQTGATNYEAQGKELTGIFTSDGDSKFEKAISKMIPYYPDQHWVVSINKNTVEGAVCCTVGTSRSGAYPGVIPDDLDIPYDIADASYAADEKFDWSALAAK
ncbi:MAG: hypothetical protein Q4F95_13020 [Oscillospiraceae bacterium]|nr:hypothetical protein [Oscillospiraceae bacterium]